MDPQFVAATPSGIVAPSGMIVDIDLTEHRNMVALSYSRLVIWCAMFDLIMVFLFLFGGSFGLILLIFALQALVGYIAGKKLNRNAAIMYQILIIAQIGVRIFMIFAIGELVAMIMMIIAILIDIVISVFVVRYIKLLKNIDPDTRFGLSQYVRIC